MELFRFRRPEGFPGGVDSLGGDHLNGGDSIFSRDWNEDGVGIVRLDFGLGDIQLKNWGWV